MPYSVMNDFHIAVDQAAHFEAHCHRSRRNVQNVPGFKTFELLRGKECQGTIHYVAHSIWASKEMLEAWTHSKRFAQAHSGTLLPAHMMRDRPHPKGFEVVILID
jgi:heme-degrading monooxygenase HmoA